MELKNHMEGVVLRRLDSVLDRYPDCCKCDKCRQDIVMLALNHLPPRYISSHKGSLYAKLEAMSVQYEIEVIEQIAKAIEIVKKFPRHTD